VFFACFCAILHGDEAAIFKNVVFSRVFARALYIFACFFAVFAYQKRHNLPTCAAAIYSVGVVPNRGSTWGKASADFDMQKQRKKHAKP